MTNRQRGRLVAYAIAGLSAGLVLVLMLAMLVRVNQLGDQLVDLADDLRAQQKANTRTIALIEDCTTVGGECYERSAERAQQIVDAIVCANSRTQPSRIRACGTEKKGQP